MSDFLVRCSVNWLRKFSEEHKQNMSKVRLGKKLSEKTKKKMSESHLKRYQEKRNSLE